LVLHYSRSCNLPIHRLSIANFSLWLGWFRSRECLGLAWSDVFALEPAMGPQMDLPTGCGLVSYRLFPETKSDETCRADVLVAYRSMSSYNLGLWFHRARRACASSPTLMEPYGLPPICKTYLYPCLHRLCKDSDPLLKPFNGPSFRNTTKAKFWSLHCYCRGARSLRWQLWSPLLQESLKGPSVQTCTLA